MSITEEKIELTKLLLSVDNPNNLTAIREILSSEKQTDFWEELTDFQKKEIEEAEEQIKNGQYKTFASVIAKHK